MNISAEKQSQITKLAADFNFYGKRLRATKLEVCDDISKAVYDTPKHSTAICDWLEANKPAKPKAAKAVKAIKNDDRPEAAGIVSSTVEQWEVKSGRRFILTSIQNNTFPHKNFLKALEQYASYYGAELLVSKFIYNKNGFQNGEGGEKIKYDPAFDKYICEKNVFLNNRRFAFMAEINVLPTADYPLTGFAETATALNIEGLAIGHAKITAESVPALKGEVVRRMYSIGTATLKNYIQQKAGQKAEALHNYGALLVEFDDDGEFFVRQLETMDESGMFYDLNVCAVPTGCFKTSDHVLGLQYGDIHAEKLDDDCAVASWVGENSLLDILKPKYQFIHDVHDFTSRNHHNRASGVFLAKQYAAGRDKVIDDLIDTGRVLESMERDFSQTIIVESNHDLALSRWLDDRNANIKDDPANAELYHSLNAAIYAAIAKQDDTFNVLDYALRNVAGCEFNAIFLTTDQSFKIAGIECGVHGHNGINGSRGNPKQFKKLGRLNTGHTHTASIYGGVYTAGVAGSLDMGYNVGASSWTQTHLITYANGQRTLIDFKNGKFFVQ
ncbi:A1 protein [Salmonella phage smaug]|uniref:A1 protein n=1 Tax=Salmonella phage smaug TaxID=2713322 RepID=A0A6G8RHR2_9CAUD|nr:A1 protein [Salmonella phage smaug]